MKTLSKRWPVWLSLLALLSLGAGGALGKDDVLRMAREGRSEQAILDAIHASHVTFELTANDIADLRGAGATQVVIDAMLESGPAQAPATPEQATNEPPVAEEPYAPEAGSEVEPQPDEPYYDPYYEAAPPPVYVAYPVYPLYYPAYYPVYDPFFPFFGGFFFSFGFVHVSHFATIFPCSHNVVVVNNTSFSPRGSLRGTGSTVFSTPRFQPRGTSGWASRPARVRLDGAARPGMMSGSRTPALTRSGPRPAQGMAPFRSPRAGGPWTQGPRAMSMPRNMQAPRALQAPRSQQAPRGMQGPRVMQMPRGGGFAPSPRSGFGPGPRSGFAPGGGFRGSSSPRAMGGGGHGHGGHH